MRNSSECREWRGGVWYAVAAVLASYAGAAVAQGAAADAPNKPQKAVELEKYVAVGAGEDPMSVLPNEPTDTVFGLPLSSLETPRSFTFLSGEMLDQYGINDLADLPTVAPSTYTTFSFGIQGGLDIRNVAADSYFRGMRRVENRSSLPTPLGATDRIEIVRGPPSPIYGNGKIGGYMNYVPRTARAATGKYLEKPEGEVSVTYGAYDERKLTAQFGGPAKLGERPAGYYVYSQIEDSGSYYQNAFNRQQILQATFNSELADTIHLETGTMLQNWRGVGLVGWNRVTQALIDHGTYGAGVPLRNLDTDGNGTVSLAEVNAAGGLIKTIPYSALGNPAALPALGPQYALDPATVRSVHIDTSNIIIEPFVDAHDIIVFGDLSFDVGADSKITNKVYGEHLRQRKGQYLSFARDQSQLTAEDKLQWEQASFSPASWITMNNVAAVNVRYSDNWLGTSSQVQIYSRPDLASPLIPTEEIANSIGDPLGMPWGSRTKSIYTETGAGALSDIDFPTLPFAMILGGRWDHVDVTSSSPLNLSNGAPADSATGSDSGFSYSASLSVKLGRNIRPYITSARESTLITGNGGDISLANVRNGPLNAAGLLEAGVKATALSGRLFLSAAYYDQSRKTFDTDTGVTTATRGKGYEFEGKFVPMRSLSISVSGNWQTTVYDPLVVRNYTISPEVAGYTAAAAQAGQIRVNLPAIALYEDRTGYPPTALALSGTYNVTPGIALAASFTHQSSFWADVMKTIRFPRANVANLSLIFVSGRLTTRISGYNLTNARSFRANQVDAGGGVMALPNPPRTGDVRFTYAF